MLKEILIDIEINFRDKNYNIQKILEKYNCSYSVLHELFYKKFEIPPSRYLENKRLEYAIELLANNQSIIITGKRCGYANSRSFRNTIHRRYNCSPSGISLKFKRLGDIKKYELYEDLKRSLWQKGENFR